MTSIERRTLCLLLRDCLKNDCLGKNGCTSRTQKTYERKVRLGQITNEVEDYYVNVTNEEAAWRLQELRES